MMSHNRPTQKKGTPICHSGCVACSSVHDGEADVTVHMSNLFFFSDMLTEVG
jgi:hypothetical protein